MPRTRRTRSRARRAERDAWAALDDESLLALRFRDLRLRVEDSLVWPDVQQIYVELERRGISFRPHVWLAEEWFSPDGIPGVAIPFYVAHPRLRQLERNMMGEVEGGDRTWRLRILRHEAGHALDTAYDLRRRADWRRVFGPASLPYRSQYASEPTSRRHVLHLGHWYAQSHPTEDFAETFAVWLTPKARWRSEYAEWPALRKLEYVDAVIDEIGEARPLVRNRAVYEPLSGNDRTLAAHYRRKRARYQQFEHRYDAWLARTFMARSARPRAVPAARFLKEIEPQLRRLLVRRARLHPYMAEYALSTIRSRARQLDLVLRGARLEEKRRIVRLHERVVFDVLRRNRENFAL